MGRTQEGNIWRFRHDLPQSVLEELEQLCRTEPPMLKVGEPPRIRARARAILQAHAPLTREWRGPAYYIAGSSSVCAGFPVILIPNSDRYRTLKVGLEPASPQPNVHYSGGFGIITQAHATTLLANFPSKLNQHLNNQTGPLTAAVVAGNAVSICYCSRLTSSAAEAGVETVEFARGQGYASAAVTAWAKAVRSQGLIPLYSTSWENLASQGVARKLRMQFYGEDWSLD